MDVRRQYRADGTIEAVELVWRDQLVDDTRLVQYQGLTFTQVVGHRSWLALASAEKAIITNLAGEELLELQSGSGVIAEVWLAGDGTQAHRMRGRDTQHVIVGVAVRRDDRVSVSFYRIVQGHDLSYQLFPFARDLLSTQAGGEYGLVLQPGSLFWTT